MDSDDIPMADESPVPVADSRNPLQQAVVVALPQNKFSIDVLSGKTDGEAKIVVNTSADPEHSDMFECDEELVLARLKALYPHVDIQKLPRQWSMSDRGAPSTERYYPVMELSTDFLRVTKRGNKATESTHKDAASLRANRPIPRSSIVYYFEIKVINTGAEGRMGVGLSEKNFNLFRLPGWEPVSYGYHGDDGHYFQSCGKGVDYGPTFTTGDIIGCGLNFITRELFFTKNGKQLGIAGTNIPIISDIYPTMGMQSCGEMIDVNFGQRPFCYDIKQDLKAAQAKVSNSIMNIELPFERVLWMNRVVTNWLTHEGYSRVLESFQKENGVQFNFNNEPSIRSENGLADSMAVSQNSQSSGSLSTRSNKKSSSPQSNQNSTTTSSSAAVKAAAATFAEDIVATAMVNATSRPSVVRSVVQQFIHEQMDERRIIVRLVRKGNCSAAIEKLEQIYPNLLEGNRQLSLLLKIQQFVELIDKTAKESSIKHDLPSTSRSSNEYSSARNNANETGISPNNKIAAENSNSHSYYDTSPRSLKRRPSDDEDDYNGLSLLEKMASENNSTLVSHKVDSSVNQQNGNSAPISTLDELMEFSGESDSNPLPPLPASSYSMTVTNGNAAASIAHPHVSNGSIPPSSTTDCINNEPHTSTTIVAEEYDDDPIDDTAVDGFDLELDADEQMDEDCDGFANAEEKTHFERYLQLIEFGQSISRFAMQYCDGPLCAPLRQRMNVCCITWTFTIKSIHFKNAFGLICYADPSQSAHMDLMSQKERDFVAKALNTAILEGIHADGTSPLDKIIRHAKSLKEKASVHSASSLLTKLLEDEEEQRASPGAIPAHKTSADVHLQSNSCDANGCHAAGSLGSARLGPYSRKKSA